jgi:hypothetical protein
VTVREAFKASSTTLLAKLGSMTRSCSDGGTTGEEQQVFFLVFVQARAVVAAFSSPQRDLEQRELVIGKGRSN